MTFSAESAHLLMVKCGAGKKIILTQKTGQFEYQAQHTIDKFHALLTLLLKKNDACEASSDSSSNTTKITHDTLYACTVHTYS